MLREDTLSNRQTGILLLSVATFSFATLDSSVKWLLQTMPLLEVVWLRFLSQAVLSAALLAPRYGSGMFKANNWRLQIVRALMLAVMTAFNFWSIQYLQLTETAAILFSSPLIVALYSHWFLHQAMRRAQWLAIFCGFVGVLIVVRPSSSNVHPAIFLMVANAFIFAGFNLLTRHLSRTETAASLQWISAVVPALLFTPFALAHFRAPATLLEWLLVLSSGFWASLGHYLLARAHQYASAATLAPFTYQQILYMAFWGWLLFGDIPPFAVFMGGGIIAASGLYLLWDQRRVAPAAQVLPALAVGEPVTLPEQDKRE